MPRPLAGAAVEPPINLRFLCVFFDAGKKEAPHAELTGVQKAPRHEVAGGRAPEEQQATHSSNFLSRAPHIDMVKESDLRLGLTDAFKSPTSHENLDRSALRPHLLLCLHGLGTNAGLQRMASLGSGVTVKDLAYVP